MLLLLIVRNAISCTLYVPYKTTLMVMNENIPWLARHSTCLSPLLNLINCAAASKHWNRTGHSSPMSKEILCLLLCTIQVFNRRLKKIFTIVIAEVSLLTLPQPLDFAIKRTHYSNYIPGQVELYSSMVDIAAHFCRRYGKT